eukprot:4453438-Pleurochrysis_carterae.AAC.1
MLQCLRRLRGVVISGMVSVKHAEVRADGERIGVTSCGRAQARAYMRSCACARLLDCVRVSTRGRLRDEESGARLSMINGARALCFAFYVAPCVRTVLAKRVRVAS